MNGVTFIFIYMSDALLSGEYIPTLFRTRSSYEQNLMRQ